MELREEEGQRQEGPRVGETLGPIQEAAEEPGHKVHIVPQEPVSTLGPIVEDAPYSPFSALIPRGERATHSS